MIRWLYANELEIRKARRLCRNGLDAAEAKDYDAFLQKLPAYFALLDAVWLPHATKRQALPGFIRRWVYQAWFRRRNLHALGWKKELEDRRLAKAAKKQTAR
ncbi:MAG: hypothetical protein IKN72_05920 [Clostridia bacterium]|nr:hypothetical protein [Clostridia bacterium]